MIDQSLMDYFKFDGADLEANRKGEYSEAQKKRLFKGYLRPRNISFIKQKALFRLMEKDGAPTWGQKSITS